VLKLLLPTHGALHRSTVLMVSFGINPAGARSQQLRRRPHEEQQHSRQGQQRQRGAR
jgi:hypothetical protein